MVERVLSREPAPADRNSGSFATAVEDESLKTRSRSRSHSPSPKRSRLSLQYRSTRRPFGSTSCNSSFTLSLYSSKSSPRMFRGPRFCPCGNSDEQDQLPVRAQPPASPRPKRTAARSSPTRKRPPDDLPLRSVDDGEEDEETTSEEPTTSWVEFIRTTQPAQTPRGSYDQDGRPSPRPPVRPRFSTSLMFEPTSPTIPEHGHPLIPPSPRILQSDGPISILQDSNVLSAEAPGSASRRMKAVADSPVQTLGALAESSPTDPEKSVSMDNVVPSQQSPPGDDRTPSRRPSQESAHRVHFGTPLPATDSDEPSTQLRRESKSASSSVSFAEPLPLSVLTGVPNPRDSGGSVHRRSISFEDKTGSRRRSRESRSSFSKPNIDASIGSLGELLQGGPTAGNEATTPKDISSEVPESYFDRRSNELSRSDPSAPSLPSGDGSSEASEQIRTWSTRSLPFRPHRRSSPPPPHLRTETTTDSSSQRGDSPEAFRSRSRRRSFESTSSTDEDDSRLSRHSTDQSSRRRLRSPPPPPQTPEVDEAAEEEDDNHDGDDDENDDREGSDSEQDEEILRNSPWHHCCETCGKPIQRKSEMVEAAFTHCWKCRKNSKTEFTE